MESSDISLLSTFSPLHLVRLASIPRKWNDVIRDQIKGQKIQNIVTFNVPIEAFSPDAHVIGDFDVQKKIPNKLGEIFSKLLFTIAAAMTIETPPYDPQGRTASNVEQTMRKQAKINGTLPENSEYKRGGLLYEITYHAFEILKAEDEKVVGYRAWFFIADKMLYNVASRIIALFEMNIARKEELVSKKNMHKGALANIENKKNSMLTRPQGPGFKMAYENYYLDLTRPRQWARIVRMYSLIGMKSGSKKKGIGADGDDGDENSEDGNPTHLFPFNVNDNANNNLFIDEDERRLFNVLTSPTRRRAGEEEGQDPLGANNENNRDKFNCFNASAINTEHVSKEWGENFLPDDHPWNPLNCLNKECAMSLWTGKVRERQRNIAEYFHIRHFQGSKEDVAKLNLEELFALDVSDSDFNDFPFPNDVFLLDRDTIVPSMLFITLPPHLLQEGSEFEKFLNIEKKREYLYSKNLKDLTPQERVERGFYDLMIIKSVPTSEAENIKDIDLDYVDILKDSFADTVGNLMANFANTGRFNGREDTGDVGRPLKEEDVDLEYNLDKDYFEQHDIFLKLRKKNTLAWKYLDSKYKKNSEEYKALKKMLEATNVWEFWRAMKHSKEVSPVIIKTRNWFFKLPADQQWPNVSSRYTKNLSLFGDFTLRHIIYVSEIERCVTNTRLARQLSKYRHNAFKYEDDRNHQRNNACIPGPGMGGKSFLLDMLANTCTPGCVHETTYVSEQAYGISGVIDGEIVILHETSKEFLGVEGAGNENKLRMLKERLEKEVVHTTTFDVGQSKENGERKRKKTACSCQGLTVFASNVNISNADGPLLSRFMVHMVPVRKGMPVGYRVKDRQKTQETELNNKEIREDERHQQVLIHTYVLFLESMIKANVFGRQVFMGTTVETTNAIIEELQKKHKMDSVDTRLNSQIELVNRSTCVEYAIMASHFTPLSFKWSRTKDRISEYNPMIFPEMVLKFLYVTKEMIVHTITLESEFWEKNMVNMVFQNISNYLLSVPSRVEFMRTSAAKDGMDATYDNDYVWVTNHDKSQVFDELAKCMNDVSLTSHEMDAIVGSVKYKIVDFDAVKPFMDNFEREYHMACNTKDPKQRDPQEDQIGGDDGDDDDNEEEENKGDKVVDNEIIDESAQDADVVDVDVDVDADMDDAIGDIPINGDVDDVVHEMNDCEHMDDASSIKSKDEIMDINPSLGKVIKRAYNNVIHKEKSKDEKKEEPEKKKKTKEPKKSKGKTSSNSTVVQIRDRRRQKQKFVLTGYHEGDFYVAFHIGELKKIEYEYGRSTTNPVVDAVKTVLGTKNYETYPEEITDALKEQYGVSDEQLVKNELITGLDGNPIVVPVEIKEGVVHDLIVPVTKYSPTITINRGPRRMLVQNYNSIPLPAQMMLFENKRMENMVKGFQEHTGRMYSYDMDYENYIQNCQLNGDDPFDEMSLLALPIFTKRVVKSAVEYMYPKMAENEDLHYPRDFFEAETKKVVNIYLYNNVATNDNVTQIVKRVEKPETMKSFTFDENGNYVQLKVDDSWGTLTQALGLTDGVASRASSIKRSQLIKLIKDKGLSQTFISKDELIDNTINNTDVGAYYTMDLLLQGDTEEVPGGDPVSENTSSVIADENSNSRFPGSNTNAPPTKSAITNQVIDETSNAALLSSDSNMSYESNNNSNQGQPRKKAAVRLNSILGKVLGDSKPQRHVTLPPSIPQSSQPVSKKRKLSDLYDGEDEDNIDANDTLRKIFSKKSKQNNNNNNNDM